MSSSPIHTTLSSSNSTPREKSMGYGAPEPSTRPNTEADSLPKGNAMGYGAPEPSTRPNTEANSLPKGDAMGYGAPEPSTRPNTEADSLPKGDAMGYGEMCSPLSTLREPPVTPLPSSGGPVIRALPPVVANQIAAGEVVERPASVVKELVENAIDAHAHRIDLVVTAGGRKLVSVADDGVGMVRDDALMCLERQATSKIRSSEDIGAITTMGFRGEAIPSIASVSRFRIATRPHDLDAGTEVEVNGGELADVRDCGCPAGTLVEVRDLFYNLPARRKFLRSYQTEQSVIRSMFLTLALANPSIAFTFKADGLELYNLPPSDSFADRLRDLYGTDVFEHLRPVDATTADVRVSGYVSTPDWTRADRSEQFLFVNRRPASAPVVYSALREAYPPLEGDRKPVVFLFLDLPPDAVDVNVHPTKREVRFRQPAAVREAIIRALSPSSLSQSSPPPQPSHPSQPFNSATLQPCNSVTPQPPPPRPLPFPRLPDPLAPSIPLPQRPPATTPDAPSTPPSPSTISSQGAQPLGHGLPGPSTHPASPASFPAKGDAIGYGEMCSPLPLPPSSSLPWKWCRIHGTLGDRFALLETDDGLVLLEPRAAHTRVLYEELLPPPGTPTPSQRLLLPESFDLPPVDAERVRSRLPVFQSMGFGIESLDGDAFLVDALPAVLGDTPSRPLLIDIAAAIEEAGPQRGREYWYEETIARASARHAVAAHGRLSLPEIESIVQRLVRCRMPYTTPFGKPTIVLLSYRELARKFGLG